MKRKIFISGMSLLAGVVILCCLPGEPVKVSVPLSNGETFRLVKASSGKQFSYGGTRWRKFLAENLDLKLPDWMPGHPPYVYAARFTNSTALVFRRQMTGHILANTDRVWNGSGRLVLVREDGREEDSFMHGVFYGTEMVGGKDQVVSEDVMLEIPASEEKMLRLRIYETNGDTQKVFVHDLRVLQPGQ